MAGMDRRRMNRFALELPAVMWCVSPGQGKSSVRMVTRNVSAGGALFPPKPAVELNTRVEVDLFLPAKNVFGAKSSGAHVRLFGTVVRNDVNGLAVKFANRYRMSRMMH